MTFTFTMDAFPDYTKFDHTKKVFCAIQIMGDENVVPQDEKTSEDDCADIDPVISGVEVGDNTDKLVRNFKAEVNRANVDFFGMISPMADYQAYKTALGTLNDEIKEADQDAELTGYYVPVKFTVQSPAGTAATDCFVELRSVKTGKLLTAKGSDGTISTIVAVEGDKPVLEANVKVGQKVSTYTFDFSKCVFR